MRSLGAIFLCITTASGFVTSFGSGSYVLHGQISLPYASIVEPVSVWTEVSSAHGVRQRVDYYNGRDSYFMFPSIGTSYEIVPTDYTTSCFITSSTGASQESFFPDLSAYKLISNGSTAIRDKLCDHYQFVEQQMNRTNTYNFYVESDSQQPVQFHFLGYDLLLGSHYDEYVFDYFSYNQGVIQQGVFDKLSSMKSSCSEMGSFSSIPPTHLFSFGPQSSLHDEHFLNYKELHGKKYNTDIEHRQRFDVFKNNLRYIHSTNRQNKGFKLAVNHLADRFDEELSALHPNHGRRTRSSNAMYTFKSSASLEKLPTNFDWREAGAVSAVKDQGICGSCWSFGAAETIEGALFLKTGVMTRLSSQALMDCSWKFGNDGCDGGNDFLAYEWIMESGYIPTEESYPYTMADGYCSYESAQKGTSIQGYVNVTSGDENALREALVRHGPISISIDASHQSFVFYSSGVYFESSCGNTVDDLDHTVLLVGFGVDADTKSPYWLVKNSWSSYWGDNGYIKMSTLHNNCGVATQPTFVII